MHSFLVAEWKTIVAVIVFCGGIFAWFYHEELRREAEENAPYPYTCLGAGEHFREYLLGTPMAELQGAVAGFARTRDDGLDVDRFESPDGAYSLNFRHGRLAAIEYYPEKDGNAECAADAEHFKSKASTVAQAIPVGGHIDQIYDGMILVQERENRQTDEGEETVYRDVGWVIIPRKLGDES